MNNRKISDIKLKMQYPSKKGIEKGRLKHKIHIYETLHLL